MINIDTRLLELVDGNEMWLLLHLTKRINTKEKICWPSNKTLCKDTGWNIDKLQKIKKSLMDKDFIQVIPRPDSSNVYKINTMALSVYVNVTDVEFEDSDHTVKNGIPPALFNSNIHTGKSSSEVLPNEVLTNEQPKQGEVWLPSEVINILNEVKSEYNIPGSSKLNKPRSIAILARMKESKCSLDDIRRMIEHRCKQWKGTKFEKFVRIETLFQASKFQGYLEEAEAAPERDWTERKSSTIHPQQSSKDKYSGIW